MSDLRWLTDEQKARPEPYFPKSHGRPRVGASLFAGRVWDLAGAGHLVIVPRWLAIAQRMDTCMRPTD